jgi:hypothetical protein
MVVSTVGMSSSVSHANSLFSIILDPPISLPHARDRISEITYLKTFNSVYAPNFKFNFIGDYGVDNIFLVHKICITCDDLDMLKEKKLIRMLDHFDMTSNSGINFMPNRMLHDSLFKPLVASNLANINFILPILGWFNDEHYKFQDHIMGFTDICTLSCHIPYWNLSNILIHYEEYLRKTLNAQSERSNKTDDIYIYHAYTLSLLLACLYNKQRRGRLIFKEREDDVDIAISDTTINTTRGYFYQVISCNNNLVFYSINKDKGTTPIFIVRRIELL